VVTAARRLSLQEAALRHGIDVQDLLTAVRARHLRALRTGRMLWVREDDLDTFLATRARRPSAPQQTSSGGATAAGRSR